MLSTVSPRPTNSLRPENHGNKGKGPASRLYKAVDNVETAFLKLTLPRNKKSVSSNKEDWKDEVTKLDSNDSAPNKHRELNPDEKPKESNPKTKAAGKRVKEFLEKNMNDNNGVISLAMRGAL